MPENYSPPLTLHRTGNPQMRAERQGTKEMQREGDAGAGEPQGEESEPDRCAEPSSMQMEEERFTTMRKTSQKQAS